MVCREILAVYCRNLKNHINRLCGQNVAFFSVAVHIVATGLRKVKLPSLLFLLTASTLQSSEFFLDQLTPWSIVLEKLTDPQLVKKLPAFHATGRFMTAFTRAPPTAPILSGVFTDVACKCFI
jgi:hypothetical protein